jgi:D-aspartate ligase
MEKKQEFIPVLLGADLCAYSVARAFHEYSKAVSHAFGRYKCGLTGFSKIVKTHVCAGLDDIKIAGPALFDFASARGGEKMLLIPCSDSYVEIAAGVSDNFPDYYTSVLPRRDLRHLLREKTVFYSFLEKYKIPYPKTAVISYSNRKKEIVDEFLYPAVIKPADSAEYWRSCKFPGMRKVYFPSDKTEAANIIDKLYENGYRGKIALQERIGGDAPKISVLTVFMQNGRAVRAVYGRVILEETGATSYGNHAAIITAPLTSLSKKLIKMLEELGYEGFANFDIISDGKNDYALEVNLRQGRSCDYMRAAGVNIGELISKSVKGEKIETALNVGKVYWHYPCHEVVRALCDVSDLKEAEELMSAGLEFSPLEYPPDTEKSILRRAYVEHHSKRLMRTFFKNER